MTEEVTGANKTEELAGEKQSEKKHFAMKLIRPRATQAVMYCAAALGSVYLTLNGGDVYDFALSFVLCCGAVGYTAFQTSRLSRTYYAMKKGGLVVCKPHYRVTLEWEEIDYALYDSTARSIELILKDGQGIMLDEYDDLKVLTQGLDMRGVRLEYKKMK